MPIEGPGERSELGRLLFNFADSLVALREFVSLIEPALNENEAQLFEDEAAGLIPLAIAVKELGEPLEAAEVFKDISTERLRRLFDGEVEVIGEGTGETRATKIRVSGKGASAWQRVLERFRRTDQHRNHLYNSTLLSLTTSAELFVSQLLGYQFSKHPESVITKDKVFSFDELASFDNIDDARNHLIATKVEDVMRGAFVDWIKVFKDRFKLSASYLDRELDDLVEIFQRRNLLVHNGGVVNSIYLSKVSRSHTKGKSLGDRLAVEGAYLDRSIDLIEKNLILVCAELWKRGEPDNAERGIVLTDIAFEHMKAERWDVAEALSFFVRNDQKLPERTQLIGRFNEWQCQKWTGKDVVVEVRGFDLTAKDQVFLLAQHAICDEIEACLRLAPALVNGGALDIVDLREWPLFRALRQDDRWVDMVDELTRNERFENPAEIPPSLSRTSRDES